MDADCLPQEALNSVHAHCRHVSVLQMHDFKTPIYKLLKNVQPEVEINKKAMTSMNVYVNQILERIIAEASRILEDNGHRTMTSKDIVEAMGILLSKEHAERAEEAGNQANRNHFG